MINQSGGVMTNKEWLVGWMVGMMLIAFVIGMMFSQNTTQAETVDPQRSRNSIQRIIEGCSISGQVFYMHNERYGSIINGEIEC